MSWVVAAVTVIGGGLATACGPSAGEEGSSLLVDYDQLSGGVVFATRSVVGAADYDLFWSSVPAAPSVFSQPLVQLTDAGGDEWQPSVSPGGEGLAYARPDDGIFYVGRDSRVRRISDAGGRFIDSLPAVSYDGAYVAWVREDTGRPISDTGFFEAQIMLARTDGSESRTLLPKPGIVQDAPRFEPAAGAVRIAWSEFDPRSIAPGATNGPTTYGLWVHNFRDNVGDFACKDPTVVVDGLEQRCFGQHLAWPDPSVLVVPQGFFQVFLDGAGPSQVLSTLLASVEGQLPSSPLRIQTALGYSTFPISASYLGDRMIFDGIVTNIDGSENTLALWVASVDGTEAWRLQIDGYGRDIDERSTNGYLFSVATPQLMP